MPARALTVVTYNIHKGLSQFNRRLVLHDIRDQLGALNADVAFLQEVQGRHEHNARRRLAQALALVLAARHRLPEAGVVGALQQEHVEGRGVDHHERGDRDLVAHGARMRDVTASSPAKNACGMSRVRCIATGFPDASTAMKPTSAS